MPDGSKFHTVGAAILKPGETSEDASNIWWQTIPHCWGSVTERTQQTGINIAINLFLDRVLSNVSNSTMNAKQQSTCKRCTENDRPENMPYGCM